MNTTLIRCRAPGKIVLWGEYAVLAGAPAAVMAVNRYASATLSSSERWRFSSQGFLSAGVDTHRASFCRAPVAQLAEAVLANWGHSRYPQPFTLVTNSEDFYQRTPGRKEVQQAGKHQKEHHQAPSPGAQKLGIGSSAAVCVAVYRALAQMLDHQPQLAEAMLVHRSFQGGKGSGLDVASSWHGGVIRFQQTSPQSPKPPAAPLSWPENLYWCTVWSGSSSSSSKHLADFARWRAHNKQSPLGKKPLDNLCAASDALFAALNVDNLARYQHCLAALDQAAKLNIFTPAHRELATIADRLGLVYKPCGAGGGDIGTAFSDNPSILADFRAEVRRQGLPILDLEIAQHGVDTTI